MGQLCPKYLHAMMSKALQDYAEVYGEVSKPIATERLRMSASTMERILRLHRFNHPAVPTNAPAAKPPSRPKSPPLQARLKRPVAPAFYRSILSLSAAATFASMITSNSSLTPSIKLSNFSSSIPERPPKLCASSNSSQPPSRVILLTFYISKALIMLGSTF